MGIYDLFTIGVAVAGYMLGRHKGLVWQVSGIGTLLVGGLCATVLSRPLGPLFAKNEVVGRFAAWVVLYAVVAVCLYILTLRMKDKIKELEFDELDKRFGGMVGGCKALAIYFVITLVAVALSNGIASAVKHSASGRTLSWAVHALRPLVPEKIHDAVWPYLEGQIPPTDDTPPAPQPTTAPPQPAPVSPQPAPVTPQPIAPQPSPPVPTRPPEIEPLPVDTEIEIQPLLPDDGGLSGDEDHGHVEEEPDPFDTGGDNPDPLAPPR